MNRFPFHPHLPPHEIARRQRWVVVGVTILGLLLFVTWLASLPARFDNGIGWQNWDRLFKKLPAAETIDISKTLNFENEDEQIKKVVNDLQILTATNASTTPIVTPQPLATSTIDILKAKIK